jgi:hypothetical protein
VIDNFIKTLRDTPHNIDFEDTMAVIEASYHYTPTAFCNGAADNTADQNQGSCKLLAFARLQGLNEAETLACFGRYYRDVVATPSGTDHQNIRQFMQRGWSGVSFAGTPLTPR